MCFYPIEKWGYSSQLLLMDEILHHLGWLKPYKWWDNHRPWWCRILSINRMLVYQRVHWLFLLLLGCLARQLFSTDWNRSNSPRHVVGAHPALETQQRCLCCNWKLTWRKRRIPLKWFIYIYRRVRVDHFWWKPSVLFWWFLLNFMFFVCFKCVSIYGIMVTKHP